MTNQKSVMCKSFRARLMSSLIGALALAPSLTGPPTPTLNAHIYSLNLKI